MLKCILVILTHFFSAGVFKLVKEEVQKTDNKSGKPKWQNVYLTIYEIEGLKEICNRFKDWQYMLSKYPSDLKEDPQDLLERLQVYFFFFLSFFLFSATTFYTKNINFRIEHSNMSSVIFMEVSSEIVSCPKQRICTFYSYFGLFFLFLRGIE